MVANYIARLVDSTHEGAAAEGVKFGASPRAALALAAAAKSSALLAGRLNASFEDVEALAAPGAATSHCAGLHCAIERQDTGRDRSRALLAAVPKQRQAGTRCNSMAVMKIRRRFPFLL